MQLYHMFGVQSFTFLGFDRKTVELQNLTHKIRNLQYYL